MSKGIIRMTDGGKVNMSLIDMWMTKEESACPPLHIKTFYGTSQNAVFTQIWIAICDYLLLIIALKMYHIEQNLYIFSNVIGQVLFERTPLNELFNKPIINQKPEDDRQLSLW